MKKLTALLVTLLVLCFTASAFAAVDDGITLTGCTKANAQAVRVCTIAWANDTGTDLGPTEIAIPAGTIIRVDFIPDATNEPTPNHDIYIYESATAVKAADLVGGIGVNLSATVTTSKVPDLGDSAGGIYQTGTIYPFIDQVTNANDDEGTIIIYIYIGN